MGTGLAIVPDFLCKQEFEKGDLQLLWKGSVPISNELYFAYWKKSIYEEQLVTILSIFKKEMSAKFF